MADLVPMVRAERRSLADFLGTLMPEQWTAPTWCDKWNVTEVVAHLTAAGNITAPHSSPDSSRPAPASTRRSTPT